MDEAGSSDFKCEALSRSSSRCISSLPKYDLKTASDNITNNNTTINVIAEESKVRDLIASIKEHVR